MFAEIRAACARVAERAEHVRIDEDALRAYATSLPLDHIQAPNYDLEHHFFGAPEATLTYLVTLDTVNFGSGYFPHLNKRLGMSGYFTVASSLKDAFEQRVPSVDDLLGLTRDDCAALFGQPLDNEAQVDLMTLFARALNDLGAFVLGEYGGSFAALVETAGGSAEALASSLTRMPFFRDVAQYGGLEVPLYKRAQITVSDIALAFGEEGYGAFQDLDALTIFADNLVPHVLRVDGVLVYSAGLADKLARGEPLASGAPEEVELRAVALHAVEALSRLSGVSARKLDIALWNRGQAPRYRTLPRHRTRTVFY